MDDLISRQAAIAELFKAHGIGEAHRRILSIAAVDAVPVRRGKWIIRETAFEDTEAKCSECGFTTLVNEPGNGLLMVSELLYCPNCGADMREEDADETD